MEYALEGGLLDNSWSSWKNMVMFDIIVEYLTILWNILQHPSISNSFWQYHQSSTNLIQDFAVLKLFGVWINQWITCIEELSLLKNTSLAPFTTRLRWKSQTKLNWETISLPPDWHIREGWKTWMISNITDSIAKVTTWPAPRPELYLDTQKSKPAAKSPKSPYLDV